MKHNKKTMGFLLCTIWRIDLYGNVNSFRCGLPIKNVSDARARHGFTLISCVSNSKCGKTIETAFSNKHGYQRFLVGKPGKVYCCHILT